MYHKLTKICKSNSKANSLPGTSSFQRINRTYLFCVSGFGRIPKHFEPLESGISHPTPDPGSNATFSTKKNFRRRNLLLIKTHDHFKAPLGLGDRILSWIRIRNKIFKIHNTEKKKEY
jgi:hypothetical protein